MNIENQTCSLGHAKILSSVGITQTNNLFYWKVNEIQSTVSDKITVDMIRKYLPKCNDYYSAFTVAELAVMLPTYNWAVPIFQGAIKPTSDVFQEVKIEMGILHKPYCKLVSLDGDWELIVRYANTLANAMASMLIKLIELEVISIDDINQSLLKQ